VNQELLSVVQEIFEQIIKVEMVQDQKDWSFNQFEFRRIVPLVEDSILLGLLDHFFHCSPPWKTIEEKDWAEIRRTIILRLE
jgi:alpha-N-acetylglucosamine transferase